MQRGYKCSCAWTMFCIAPLVQPLRVVEQREQAHHIRISADLLGDVYAVMHHPRPVSGPVDAAPVKPKLPAEHRCQTDEMQHIYVTPS